MSARRCHCGSVMIPLFNFFACKAECDLPLSMRTKPKRQAAKPANFGDMACGVRSAPAAPLWVPAVGDWVRITATWSGACGGAFKVDGVYGPKPACTGLDVRGQGCTYEVADLEPWKPRVGERVQIMQGYHQGDIGFVVRLSPCDITVAVAGADRFFGLSELEPA